MIDIGSMKRPAETNRLSFDAWREQDVKLAEALWCDRWVMAHMGGPVSPDQACARLDSQLRSQQEHGVQYWRVHVKATREFMGCCGLRVWIEDPEILEMGCHIMGAGWGLRYGEEACRSVLSYGFDQLCQPVIVAGHNVSNVHSAAMLSRLGFTSTHKSFYKPGGFDVLWYEIRRNR
jgi:[ribosomal protein S5]-alanine N-acetyltransferase